MRAPAIALAKRDPDGMRESLIENVAEDWVRGIAEAVRGDGCWERPQWVSKDGSEIGPIVRKPQRWAFRLVAEVAKMVGMPQGQMLAIIQREVGVDLADAKLAVSVWQDSRTLGEEAKREVAEEFLARHYNLPVGVLRDALQRACGARVGDNGGGQGS